MTHSGDGTQCYAPSRRLRESPEQGRLQSPAGLVEVGGERPTRAAAQAPGDLACEAVLAQAWNEGERIYDAFVPASPTDRQ
jgi:hypothetical protein